MILTDLTPLFGMKRDVKDSLHASVVKNN